jgi:hypothetical protein
MFHTDDQNQSDTDKPVASDMTEESSVDLTMPTAATMVLDPNHFSPETAQYGARQSHGWAGSNACVLLRHRHATRRTFAVPADRSGCRPDPGRDGSLVRAIAHFRTR